MGGESSAATDETPRTTMSDDKMQHGKRYPLSRDAQLINDIAHIVEQARQRVRTAVNTAMVYAYYEIGRHIVEYEQGGNYGGSLFLTVGGHL